MDRGRVRTVLISLLVITLLGVLAVELALVVPPWVQDRGGAVVTLIDTDSSEQLARVDVEVADTRDERYTGLSEHESLAEGQGMLFVYDGVTHRTFVMRDMDFPIDMIFVGANRRITAIHHARAPGPNEDGEDIRYSARAKYVLEVPRGFANDTGLSVGDRIDIDDHGGTKNTTVSGRLSMETARSG